MLIAVDIGNSNITVGVFGSEAEPRCTFSLSAKEARSSDEYLHLLLAALQEKAIPDDQIADGAIASVVPLLTASFEQALEKLCGRKPLILGPGVKTGLSIRTDSPVEVGADIIANAAAAADFGKGAVIADFGTVTTIFAVGEKRELLGGAILPGVQASSENLRAVTAQLPAVSLQIGRDPLGRNTADCIANGLILGHAFAVDEFARRYGEGLGEEPFMIATGGLASLILPHCKVAFIHEPHLTLKGLRLIYEKTRKTQIS